MDSKIGIIGCGNMGSAIGEQLTSHQYEIWVFDKDATKTDNLLGVKIAKNNSDLVNNVDTVILAVKPQDFDNLLDEIKDCTKEKLIISIAAGITTNYIEKRFNNVRVVRVMPNMPARIGKGMSCLCKGKFITDEDLNFSKKLFEILGETLILNEDMMDAATAISGSGPGYFYDLGENKSMSEIKKFANSNFIPDLTASAESIGFSSEQAKLLVNVTAAGSLALLQMGDASPSELKKQITSKGGTTEAALKVLHNGGSLKEAVRAARDRAKELSRR